MDKRGKDEGKLETGRFECPIANEMYGTTRMTGDYAKLAEGMGAVGIVVTNPGEMADALKQAQQHNANGRTVLIDVHSNMEPKKSRF